MGYWGVKFKPVTMNPAFRAELRIIMRLIMEELAELVEVSLKVDIESGRPEWAPLSEVTKWLKGSEKVLVNRGDLLRAIDKEVGANYARVGILIPRGPRGQDMELIAKVIEGGAIIPVTDKMRRWFGWKGIPLRRTTMHIIVPPRPLFEPAMTEVEDYVEEIVMKYLDDVLEAV